MSGWVIHAKAVGKSGLSVATGAIESPADRDTLQCGWINPFRGWVLLEETVGGSICRHRPQALRVYSGDQRVGSCQCGLPRPDLVGPLTGQEAVEAGFQGYVYVPAPFSAPLRLIAVLRDGSTRLFARWDPRDEPGPLVCFGYLDRRATPVFGGSGEVEVTGWAFIPGHLTCGLQVFLDGHPSLECAFPLPRPDVARRFAREPQAGMSGFRAIFPESGNTGKPVIRVQVTDQDGRAAELS